MKIILITVALSSTLLAQDPKPTRRIVVNETVQAGGISAVAPGTTVERQSFFYVNGPQSMELISGMGVGPTVTKSPYSAEAVSESIQTLYDGNRIVQKTSAKQFRDSEGRERREESGPLNAIFITDPVAKLSYTLHPDNKTAEKMVFGGQNMTSFSGAFGATRLNVTTAQPPNVTIAAPGNVAFAMATRIATTSTAAKEEDLGTRMIEGVQAKGTRSTVTIPAGEIGNDRAIDIVDERWSSPDLQLTVLTRHADPRMGETTFKLTSIQRLEQVRSLFEVPPGYTIHEAAVFTRPLKEE